MKEEFNLSEKIQELFDLADKGKLNFLKNKREIEVFKLSLKGAFEIEKKFINIILDYGEKVAMTSEDLMEEIKERAGDKFK